jgi:hypothetical protein
MPPDRRGRVTVPHTGAHAVRVDKDGHRGQRRVPIQVVRPRSQSGQEALPMDEEPYLQDIRLEAVCLDRGLGPAERGTVPQPECSAFDTEHGDAHSPVGRHRMKVVAGRKGPPDTQSAWEQQLPQGD